MHSIMKQRFESEGDMSVTWTTAVGAESAYFERCTHSTTVFEGRIMKVRCDNVALSNGSCAIREVVDHVGGVGVLAFDDDDQVLLVKQYRYPLGRELLEIPAGTLSLGEDPAHCGRRELSEETGAVAGRFEPLGSFVPTPGFSGHKLYLFMATELEFGECHPDEDELLFVIRMPFSDLVERVMNGTIEDAKTVVSVLMMLALRSTSK